jgi:hypothetical protein
MSVVANLCSQLSQDAEIVRFVTTVSDKGEEDDFQGPAITRQQAAEQAKSLRDYIMLCTLENVTRQLAHAVVHNRKESTL